MFLPKFSTLRKLIFLLILCSLLFLFSPKPVQAFSSRDTFQFQFEQAVFKTEEMNLQSFVYETMKTVSSSITTSFVGCFSCTAEERQKNPGFILAMGNFIAALYASPPASGVQYLAYLGNQIGIVQPAYAQEKTAGFQTMEKVLPVWTAFRNITYVLFVLIFVFMGFAIMLRVKISPQAVITIQSALPRIIIALILVTFSYAIVGFMIDLMYVSIFLIEAVFRDILLHHLGALGDVIEKLFNSLEKLNVGLFGMSVSLIVKSVFTRFIFFFIVPLLALAFLFLTGPFGWLFGLIVVILIIIALLRSLWTLLKAYAMIILNLIFAPLMILVGVLPGNNTTRSWFRNTIANIVVLPIMIAMFFLSSYLILVGISEIATSPLIIVFLISLIPGLGQIAQMIFGGVALSQIMTPSVPFWQMFSTLLLPIIGLIIILMAPKISDMIKTFLAEKPFDYGTAIGEAVGPVKEVVGPVKEVGKGVFYLGAGEIVGPGGFLERAGKSEMAMAGRKILKMK